MLWNQQANNLNISFQQSILFKNKKSKLFKVLIFSLLEAITYAQ